MVIQAIVGLFAVAGTSLYMFRQRIKAFFQRRGKTRPAQLGVAWRKNHETAARKSDD
jgi:hypothetical protein